MPPPSTYFNEIAFRMVAHSYPQGSFTFTPTWNSLEYMAAGSVRLERDGARRVVTAPALFWMEAGHRVQLEWGAPDRCSHFYIDMWGPRSVKIVRFLGRACPDLSLRPRHPKVMEECFADTRRCFQLDPTRWHAMMALNVEKIIALAEESLQPEPPAPHDDHGVHELAEKIRQNPLETRDFAEFAARHGISYDYLRRLFRAHHRMPLHEYIRNRRMEQAKQLLLSQRMRIKEVAGVCGFDDLAAFSRAFKRHAGQSPRAFLRNQE